MALSHNSTIADNEPDWGAWLSDNRSKLPDQAFADREERGFPHHWVRDGAGEDADGHWTEGEMFLHRGALQAAFAAAMGARTGQRAGQEIIDHLEAHRRAIGMGEESQRMASMVSTLRAIGDKGEAEVKVLFDTGAAQSFALRSVAEKLATIIKLPRPYKITVGDGRSFTITETAILALEAAGQKILDTFLILEKGVEDIILGESTMRKYGLKIDLERSVIFSEIKTDLEDKSMWKKFLAALGITVTDEPTEEKAVEILKGKIAEPGAAQLAAAKMALTTLKGVVTILGLAENATEDTIKGTILALKDRGDVVSRADYEQLLAHVRENGIEQVIAAAMQGEEAKLTPAMKPGALQIAKDHGLDTLKNYVAALPKLGIFAKLPEKKEGAAAAVKIDDVQAAVNKQLGLSQETFLKYNAN